MSWWKAFGSPRRSPRNVRSSDSRSSKIRALRRRVAELLEARCLLAASDSFVEFNLASNIPNGGLVFDPSLGYAWGIATSPGASGGFSVSAPTDGGSESFSGDVSGSPFSQNVNQSVSVPSASGQVYNGNANEFIIHSIVPPGTTTPTVQGPAEFLYASLDGTIYGSNPSIGSHAVSAVSLPGAAFTGLTIANNGTADQLYAADFLGGKIDVFDTSFKTVTTTGSFTDPNLPANYRPFNIQALGGDLYVSYADVLLTPATGNSGGSLPPTLAPGGAVDVFDANGNLLGRIASGAPLDQPWGMTIAPASFGQFAGDLLVANHGDGKIDAFNPTPGATTTTGTSLGTLDGADGNPLEIDGLWALTFGNGGNAGDAGSLYFSAGSSYLVAVAGDDTAAAPAITSLPIGPGLPHGAFGTVQVAATDPLVAVGTNTTAIEGERFSGALAVFGSADPPSPTASTAVTYTATIDWGDGTSSAGTIALTDDGLLVMGSHTYTAAGTENYQVTIADSNSHSTTATGTVAVTAATLAAHAVNIDSHGLTVDNAPVATFTDPGGADPLADYSATIDWGDGSTSAGTVVAVGARGNTSPVGDLFTVSGSHTYTAAGDYTFTVTISDTDGSPATVQGTADVAQATLDAHALPVQSQGLAVNNANVATFIDTDGGNPLSDYSATIDWGDGSSSVGTINALVVDPPAVSPTVVGLNFFVEGSHTYTAAGDYTFTVTISDTDGSQATVQGTVDVAQATLEAHALAVQSQGLAVNNANVANFIDTGGADPLSNYSATIDWGDGSSSAGTIAIGAVIDPPGIGGLLFDVAGSHTYAAAGDYTFTVTISDTDGSHATVQGTLDVAEPTLLAHALPVISQGLGVNNVPVAYFTDTGGADPLSNYSATIDWGDGSTSAGTIIDATAHPPTGVAVLGGFTFTVEGSHTYAATGDYTYTVTISDTDGSHTTVQGTAHIAEPPLLATGVPVVVTSGLSVNGAIVAAFADAGGGDPLSNYSATIDWGDGTSSTAGTVTGSGNSFIVAGSHAYAVSGDYELTIAISDQDGSTANVSAHAFIDAPLASFVASAFENVLHRAADDSGLSYWTQQLTGGLPSAQFASDLTHSAEFYATNVIDPAYQTYLGRAADTAGVTYWTIQMQQGLTDQQIEANFIASSEFYAKSGGTNADWVDALYQVVLGRPADSAGLDYWLAQLSSGASRSNVAAGFAAGQEREAQIIQNDYFTYLGRSASPAEVNFWVAQFEQGVTNEDIVSQFVGSSEYVKDHS
ncbi:MAG TPA: TIGR03118 family protein [Pirellulales bacterium]|nr:TIGR03118 family protein [Pirellulales bacterium]